MQNKSKIKLYLAVLSLTLASFLVSAGMNVEYVFAYSATLTTNNAISLDALPTDDGTTIHSESINVQSDCRAGYNLTIATPQGSNLYADGDNTQSASFTAVDGTSALNSSNNTNKWGYTLTSNPTSATVFSPLSATASTLKTPSQTASPSSDINDTFNINYGIKTDVTVDPGSYKMANNGTILYYLTMDTTCTQYTVAFNANGGTGSINNQTIEVGEETKLTSADSLTAPTGASYTDAGNNTISGDADKIWTFWGWNTQIDGTGDWYKDKEAVEDIVGAGTTLTLYAQWKQATLADMVAGTQVGSEKVIDHNLMQDMKPEVCYNSPITTAANAPAATLLDYRGKVTTGASPEQPEEYTVSKLADGLCWMTTNLNLGRASGGPNGDGTITLTSDDTDLADNATFTLPVSAATSDTSYSHATIFIANASGNNNNGTYYSWPAAIAYTIQTDANPTTSICPKNWDLPASSQYTNLSSKSVYSSSNQTTAAPSSFLVDGGFTDGATFYQTGYSHFWTNTSYSYSRAYGARVNSTAMAAISSSGTTYGGDKYYRKNLRCVASQGKATVNYNGNGSDGGSTASQENVEISSTNLNANGFTRTHYSFKNWNTEANGEGTTIANNASLATLGLKPGDTITLYAQWTPQRQIVYNDNCSYNNAGCATNADTTNTSNWTNAGGNITLGSDAYFTTRPGYAITSWNTARDGSGTSYNPSANYSIPSSLVSSDQVTMYAQWSPALTINFNSNGGSGIMAPQLILENTSKALNVNSFTGPSGLYFAGWMTEESRATNTVVYANGATYTAPTTVTPGDSITLYAKWGPKYTIVYNGNSATGGSMVSSGTELKHTNINEGTNVNLYAPNYYKTNYGFVGWSPSPTATVGGADPIYGPNESISAPDYDLYGEEINGVKTVTLYAVWMQADTTKTMQTFGYSDCQVMPQAQYNSTTGKIIAPAGSVIALKDQRDGNVYAVARLADGNCWMTENLRLEAANTVGNNQYDSSVTNESLAQGYDGVFTGLDSAENSNFTNTTNATPNNMYNSMNITGGYYPEYRFPRYNNSNTNTSLTANYNSIGSGATYYSWYSYGNYYTSAAAIANTANLNTVDFESTGTSICPANWSLPLGGPNDRNGSFYHLNQQMGKNTSTQGSKEWRSFPNNFLYSGTFSGSNENSRNVAGYYWSRSVSLQSSYNLYLSSTQLGPYSSNNRYNGYSVRCMTANPTTPGYINYFANADDAEGTMGRQAAADGNTVTLFASNFSRDGYGFAGWSDAKDYETNANAHFYGPNEDITVPAGTTTNGLALYAVWIESEGDLQDSAKTASVCNSLTAASTNGTRTLASVSALTDTRDGQIYAIAKLADGKCWMIENLRLADTHEEGNNTVATTLTTSNTNNPLNDNDPINPTVTLKHNYSDTQTFTNLSPTSDVVYDATTAPGGWCASDSPACDDQSRLRTDNIIDRATYNSMDNMSADANLYSYGNYYNWYSATAGNGTYSKLSGEVTGDLCPSGWQLPYGDSTGNGNTPGGFYYLNYKVNNDSNVADSSASKNIRSYPNNYLYSSYVSGDEVVFRGHDGFYWSSKTFGEREAHAFLLYSSHIAAGSDLNSKYYGFTVRCLADS